MQQDKSIFTPINNYALTSTVTVQVVEGGFVKDEPRVVVYNHYKREADFVAAIKAHFMSELVQNDESWVTILKWENGNKIAERTAQLNEQHNNYKD